MECSLLVKGRGCGEVVNLGNESGNLKQINPEFLTQHHLKMEKVKEPKIP
jgi:hypothetical protein